MDHVTPTDLWRGAHDDADADNLKAACASCNNLSPPNKQRKLAERHPSAVRAERDGGGWPMYKFAFHRCGTYGLFGYMYPGQPILDDCPADCPRSAA